MPLATALAVLLSLASPGVPDSRIEAPPERAYSAFSTDPARRFDFWIGEWDVNLRTLQDDLTFDDSVAARASIYPILDGKAILELWDSTQIKGFSLRYYDPTEKKWELWLDWPGPNRSRLERMEGSFRHGRGEFSDTSQDAEGKTIMTVFSFNDITPFSLRWDDRYSSDDGKTWKRNWVMEFTRWAVDPRWPIRRGAIPTYTDGKLCDDERFRTYELLLGTWRSDEASFEVFPILDGCAVIGFLEDAAGADEFVFMTFDTFEERWVEAVLDDRPETGFVSYTGAAGWAHLESENDGALVRTVSRRGGGHLGQPGDKLHYRRGDRDITLERVGDTK